MRSSHIAMIVLVALCAAGRTAAAQPPPPQQPLPPRGTPARDSAREQKGTGVIRGRIVAADSGRPLRRARITLSSPTLAPGANRSTSTDQSGRYELRDLVAAR